MISSIVTTMVIDKIMYGLGAGKLMLIVTSCEAAVAAAIEEATGRGCTFLEGQGSYSLDEKKVVMCACNNSQVIPVSYTHLEIECVVLTIFTAGERDYIALLPMEGAEAEEGEVYLYRYSESEDGQPNLETIDDDDEYEIVADAFDELLDDAEYDELVGEDETEENE